MQLIIVHYRKVVFYMYECSQPHDSIYNNCCKKSSCEKYVSWRNFSLLSHRCSQITLNVQSSLLHIIMCTNEVHHVTTDLTVNVVVLALIIFALNRNCNMRCLLFMLSESGLVSFTVRQTCNRDVVQARVIVDKLSQTYTMSNHESYR